MLIGTPEYMAPEQLRGEPPSQAWDLWSLAIIAVEALSASIDLAAEPTRVITRQEIEVAVGVWSPAMALRDAWPHSGAFFVRALSLDKADRPQDARSFYVQLEHALIADGVRTEHTGRLAS
jgi:serine/threonine-protein kinase